MTWLSQVECVGNETSLLDCPTLPFLQVYGCTRSDLAGVRCQSDNDSGKNNCTFLTRIFFVITGLDAFVAIFISNTIYIFLRNKEYSVSNLSFYRNKKNCIISILDSNVSFINFTDLEISTSATESTTITAKSSVRTIHSATTKTTAGQPCCSLNFLC